MKKVYFDTETTSLAPGNIAQLSLIMENDDGKIEAKNYFFDIDYISDGAAKACGRNVDFYREASKGFRFKDYKDELLQIFENSTLIAHNEKFDENFLCTEFWRLGTMFKPADKFCTMEFFKDILKIPGKGKNKYKYPKLDELLMYYNVDLFKINEYTDKLFGTETQIGFHDSRFDATALFVAFQMYKESLVNKEDWKNTFTKTA